MSSALLEGKALAVGYQSKQGDTVLLDGLDVSLNPSQFVCLLGPNGAGKSRLQGDLHINGNEFEHYSIKERAKIMAVILTDKIDAIGLSGREVVQLGRIPYTSWSGRLGEEDLAIVEKVIQIVEAEHLVDRPFAELSDGEKQRVLIARALAQQPKVLILDEPTAHLDLTWKVEVMLLLRKLCHEKGLAIVMSSHDLDLSLKLADKIWLIDNERSWYAGMPEELALDNVFQSLFSNKRLRFESLDGSWKIQESTLGAVNVKGHGAALFWTTRLLERIGLVIQKGPASLEVEVIETDQGTEWMIEGEGAPLRCRNLSSFIEEVKNRMAELC